MSKDYTKGDSGAGAVSESVGAYVDSVDCDNRTICADDDEAIGGMARRLANLRPPWTPDTRPEANGRKPGVIYPTEALTRYVGTGELPPPPLTPAWRIAKAITERAETGDPRAVTVVLDRVDGKVPERVQVGLIQGVTLLPSDQLEPELWGRLYGHGQRLGVAPAIPATALPAVQPEDDAE